MEQAISNFLPPVCEKVVANGSRGCCPSFASPLEAVFWFFGGFVAVRSRGRGCLRASGEGLGGGYCTPPNHRDVSEANSFFLLRFRSNFRVIHRLGLCFKCSVCSCVPRAILLCAASKGEKFRTKGEKFRTKGESKTA